MSHLPGKRKQLGNGSKGESTEVENPSCRSEEQIWKNLCDWVHQAGGFVHPSLKLTGQQQHGATRGLITTAFTPKGDLLIQIPPQCVLSGMHVPSKVDGSPTSPWLRCLGALLQAKKDSNNSSMSIHRHHILPNTTLVPSYTPYIESLPSRCDYETLFQWSIHNIQQFLGGTTLGKMLLLDRNEKNLEKRYMVGVVPFLEHLGVLETRKHPKRNKTTNDTNSNSLDEVSTSPDYESFLEAAMCISTRGFHLTNDDDEDEDDNKRHMEKKSLLLSSPQPYNGPFLLPVIDLLNHDPTQACTTLQRDSSSGNFTMIAERSLTMGEEVVHSYGNELTSAQLLQTFGFVPRSHTTRQILDSTEEYGCPVSLHKIDHLIRSCLIVKNSVYPQEIQTLLSQRREDTIVNYPDNDDFWDVQDIPDRRMVDSIPDEIMVSLTLKDTHGSLLSEDLITLLAVQFLPEDAFVEIFQNKESTTTRLDRSILEEDPYLGMLICHSLLTALSIRVEEYTTSPPSTEITTKPPNHHPDKITNKTTRALLLHHVKSIRNDTLSRLAALSSKMSTTLLEDREICGRTIQAEELTSLIALTKEVTGLLDKLSSH